MYDMYFQFSLGILSHLANTTYNCLPKYNSLIIHYLILSFKCLNIVYVLYFIVSGLTH